jgi:hypothetical protein
MPRTGYIFLYSGMDLSKDMDYDGMSSFLFSGTC